MSITDELREWAFYNRHYEFIESSGGGYCELLSIADRIDAGHEHDTFNALRDGFNLGRARGYDEGFKAHLAYLEARVERIERLLSHKEV